MSVFLKLLLYTVVTIETYYLKGKLECTSFRKTNFALEKKLVQILEPASISFIV